MENLQKYSKLKQYIQLFFLIMIAITIVLVILGNSFGKNLLIISTVGYLGCEIFIRKIPESDDESFNTKINFITKCVTYPTYVLFAWLMFKTWMERT